MIIEQTKQEINYLPNNINEITKDWIPNPFPEPIPQKITSLLQNRSNSWSKDLDRSHNSDLADFPRMNSFHNYSYDYQKILPIKSIKKYELTDYIKPIEKKVLTNNKIEYIPPLIIEKEEPREIECSAAYITEQIAIHQAKLDEIQCNLITKYLELIKYVKLIIKCKEKSIYFYKICITTSERNIQFDELIAHLGNGHPPEKNSDILWKKEGLKGIRSIFIEFYNFVQNMAEIRLTLNEWKNYSMKNEILRNNKLNFQITKDRWRFIYNNIDIVKKSIKL